MNGFAKLLQKGTEKNFFYENFKIFTSHLFIYVISKYNVKVPIVKIFYRLNALS